MYLHNIITQQAQSMGEMKKELEAVKSLRSTQTHRAIFQGGPNLRFNNDNNYPGYKRDDEPFGL